MNFLSCLLLISSLLFIHNGMAAEESLKIGDTVFALEKVDCKNADETFILFYKGRLQNIQNGKTHIIATERYALWYDRNYKGIDNTDWWCIPKKRFCFSKISFLEWNGKIKQDAIGEFKTAWTIPSTFEITDFAENMANQVCSLGQVKRKQSIAPVKKSILANEIALFRIISQHHYLGLIVPKVRKAFDTIGNIEELNIFLKTLDPYSKYVSKEQNDYYKKRASLIQIGLGLNIHSYNDKLIAVPLAQGPAAQSGYRTPSYLVSLNNRKITAHDFSSFSFISRLLPKAKIPLVISTLKAQVKKYIIRVAKFKNPSIEYLKEGNIRLIRIHKFDGRDQTAQKLKRFLLKAMKHKNKPIIIDLRYCPGGSLFEAIDAVSLFIPPNIELSYIGKSGKKKMVPFISLSGQIIKKQKIFVWVSSLTASAAEVFGNILQYYAKNVVIIGNTTQGKCLSQKKFEFDDGSALHLSVFEIFGPNKEMCQGIGITPDIMIPPTEMLNSQYYFKHSNIK
ncbi:MAG: hypothetical protein KAH77_09670 [Thiomargarita sp.]|nr:hypothetical protein [Thiomargarita sp.]